MEGTSWYDAATHELPMPTATVADIENEGDVRKTLRVKVKGWHLKLFNLHEPSEVKAYEKLRVKLYSLLAAKRAQVARDVAQVLMVDKSQKLFQLVEWVEFDFSVQKRETAEQVGVTEAKNE